ILMLTNLQLRQVQATDTKDTFLFGHYLATRLISCLVALTIVLLIMVVSGYDLDLALIIILIFIAKAIESISEVIYGLLQKNERLDIVSRSKIINGLLSIILLSITIWITRSLFFGALSLILSKLVTLLFYEIRKTRHFTKIIPIFSRFA